MEEHYLSKNTDSLKLTANLDVNSSLIIAKKKQCKVQSFSGVLQLIILFTIFCIQLSFGQDATQYTFSTSTGATLNSMTGSSQILASTLDFTSSAITNIGFTFNYCGTNYTQFSVSSNGSMSLGSTVVTNSDNNLITNSAPLILPLWDDMHTCTNGKVHYLLSGSSPNRILTIEWLFGNYAERASSYTKTVQVTLQETTNVINFTYGANTGAPITSATVGINSSTTLFQCINTTANTASTTANNNNTLFPASGRKYTWTPPLPPTITSLGSASGCVGNSITINGTSLSGATAANVKIGGTAVSSIISNSGTVIVATIGTGTTGTVSVTTPVGTATSAATFAVNPLPVITTQPAATSICTNGSGTFTVATTGATTYTWRRNSVNLTNGAIYSNANTATLTITNPAAGDAGNFDVIVGNAQSCNITSNAVALTIRTTPAITTNPNNASAPTGTNTSFTVAASNSPTTYTWEVSTNGGTIWSTVSTGGVYTNATAATLNITGTTIGMNNYKYRASATNSCGTTVVSSTATLTVTLPYCTPSTTNGGSSLYISQVNIIGTLSDPGVNNSTYNTGYQNFADLPSKAKQADGEGINIVSTCDGTVMGRGTWKAWVDWNNDGDFVDAGEEVYNIKGWVGQTQTFGFVIPAGQTPGDYRIRIRVNNGQTYSGPPTKEWLENGGFDFNPCENFGSPSGSLKYYGEAEDYLFTVISSCASKITSITPNFTCGTDTVNLAASGIGAIGYNWYDSEFGGALLATTATGNWKTPSIAITTTYWVTSFNGTCESVARTQITATVKPITTLTVSNATPTVCGEGSIIDLSATGGDERYHLIKEDFEGGTLGAFSNINTDTSTDAGKGSRSWANKTSTYVPNSTDGNTWFPALSSGFGVNKFVMTKSDSKPYPNASIENSLTSNAVSATGVTNLKLKLKLYYSRYWADGTHISPAATTDPNPEYVTIEATYNNWAGVTTLATITSDTGIGSRFATLPIYSLPAAFNNQAAIKIRVKHHSWASGDGYLGDGVAVDDVELYGDKPLGSPSFVLSGSPTPVAFTTALCTPGTEYLGGPVLKIWVKPTLPQLELDTYSFTATATLSNNCPISTTINVTNQTKVWKGTTDNDWNKSSNWLPAVVPIASTCVIIPTGTTSKIMNTPDNFAKTVTIKGPTGNLELQSDKNLTVTDNIIVETGAAFNIRDKASLVQKNNVANTGIVNVERNSSPIKKLDYTYWSSPVSGFTLGQFSTANSYANSYMYSWLQTVLGSTGNWQPESDATIMTPAKGYIIRTPWGHPENTAYPAKFSGTPNNGDIKIPIYKGTITGTPSTSTFDGTDEDDEWNLIGNPYPSAVDIAKFIDLPANKDIVNGTVYIWMHNSQPSAAAPDPFYGDYALNYTSEDYATVNKTGGTAIASTSIAGTIPPTEFIPSGQSFFIKAATGLANNGTKQDVTFNNDMRVTGNNNSFSKIKLSKEAQKHRVWLNLTNNSGAFSQILVGYLADATQGLDRGFDGENLGGNDVTFYSILPEAQLTIQGRALPFDENDQVTLGYNSEISGELSIRIDHIDGLFATQNIYLEDKEQNVIHDLKEAPYVFTTEIGDFNDRFTLRFTDKTLGTDTFNLAKANEVNVIVNQNVTVQSSNQLIKNIAVYDLLGRKIDSYKKVNALKYTLSHLNKTTAGLIVKITLDNDSVVSKKIIY